MSQVGPKYAELRCRLRPINLPRAFIAILSSSVLSVGMPLTALPANTPSGAEVQPPPVSSSKPACILLEGTVSDEVYPQLERRVSELFEIALQRQTDNDLLNSKGKHFNAIWSRAYAGSKDILELLTEYKGFEQSSEAGDIVLGERLKLKSKSSAEYAKQLKRDQTERDLFTAMMQIAEGLGCSDSDQSKTAIDQGLDRMNALVGEEESQKTLKIMKDWCAAVQIRPSIFDAHPLTILETEQESKAVLDAAMKTDPVVGEIKHTVHKYFNGRSNLARVTAKVVNFTLSVTGYSPTVISPVSQVAWTVYIATQGGPEEAKLLKEVYLAKCFDSRFTTLSADATLAVNSHNKAVLTKNPSLLAVSEWLVDRASETHKMPIATKAIVESSNDSGLPKESQDSSSASEVKASMAKASSSENASN
jgi:hypothetical protein